MRQIWARVGMGFDVPEEKYVELQKAIKEIDYEKVKEILFSCEHCRDGDSYLPADDFTF